MIESPPGFVVQEECRKAAWERGFRREVEAPPGWMGFTSTTVPCTVFLAASSGSGPWFVGVDHAGVLEVLGLEPSTLPGPGLARYQCPGLPALYDLLSRVYQLAASLPDAPLLAWRSRIEGLPQGTEAERLVVQRLGQDLFREGLLEFWNRECPLTGIRDPELLRASHIVPWKDCATDAQRLDVHNGLLLSALWDAAFDRGLVTFTDAGVPEFSLDLSEPARVALSWRAPVPLTARQRENLRWHRVKVFRGGGE
jgi:hypothetical protein